MMEKRQVSLQDKYILEEGRAFMTGIQALVRLPMVQRRLDQSRGWDTGGFISGYRGSPLGALDQQLVLNRKLLEDHHVRFNPGVNEDLAATSIWGTQQAELHGQGRYDGVFGLWYGKGPGVDRSGDALRHANLAGTSAKGGVLALMGDDLRKLPFTIRLSRKALTIIKQNIAFSLGLKVLALLLVIPGWLTLWIAIFADMGATLLVTLNSLRLLKVKDK